MSSFVSSVAPIKVLAVTCMPTSRFYTDAGKRPEDKATEKTAEASAQATPAVKVVKATRVPLPEGEPIDLAPAQAQAPKGRKLGPVAYIWMAVFALGLLVFVVLFMDAKEMAEAKLMAVEQINANPEMLKALNKFIGYSVVFQTGLTDIPGYVAYMFGSTVDSSLGNTYSGRGRPFMIAVEGSRGKGMVLGVYDKTANDCTDLVLVKAGGDLPPMPLKVSTVMNEKGYNVQRLLGSMKRFVMAKKDEATKQTTTSS